MRVRHARYTLDPAPYTSHPVHLTPCVRCRALTDTTLYGLRYLEFRGTSTFRILPSVKSTVLPPVKSTGTAPSPLASSRHMSTWHGMGHGSGMCRALAPALLTRILLNGAGLCVPHREALSVPSAKVMFPEKQIDVSPKRPICEGFCAILWTDRNCGFPTRVVHPARRQPWGRLPERLGQPLLGALPFLSVLNLRTTTSQQCEAVPRRARISGS